MNTPNAVLLIDMGLQMLDRFRATQETLREAAEEDRDVTDAERQQHADAAQAAIDTLRKS